MKADPTAVRLHRAYVPYGYVRRPQRVSVRQQMHGRYIQPMHSDPDYGGLIGLVVMFVVAVFIGFALVVQL